MRIRTHTNGCGSCRKDFLHYKKKKKKQIDIKKKKYIQRQRRENLYQLRAAFGGLGANPEIIF
jgi:hypothetical protein